MDEKKVNEGKDRQKHSDSFLHGLFSLVLELLPSVFVLSPFEYYLSSHRDESRNRSSQKHFIV